MYRRRFKAAGAVLVLGAALPSLALAAPGQGAQATADHAQTTPSLPAQTQSGQSGAAQALHATTPAPAGSNASGSHRRGAATCPSQTFSQPFLAWGDHSHYTLLAGETSGDFGGAGWTLSGGARIVTDHLRNGQLGHVLYLPAGSRAVSPAICVTSAYPKARTMVKDLAGSAGVHVFAAFQKNGKWGANLASGNVKGLHGAFSPSVRVSVHATSLKGATPTRYTLVASRSGRYEIYDFYVDPRMSS